MIELVSPFPHYGIPRAWLWLTQFRGVLADDFFPSNYNDFAVDWLKKERGGRRSWGVMRDGLLGGVITSDRLSPTVADFHCLFSRDFWGKDTVVPALGQACDLIFKDASIDKLSTVAFARNMSLAGMMKHFGVTREGLLHGHTRQGGKLVDLQVLGLERRRFYVAWDQQSAGGQLGEHNERSGESNLRPVDQLEQHVDGDVDRDPDANGKHAGRLDGYNEPQSRATAVPNAAAVGHADSATVDRS